VTAAQLNHLVELAAYASGFFCTTDPEAARTFADAASRAEALSAEIGREEEDARHRPEWNL
jgi:uncharacterized protein (DUF1786 family)